MAIKKQGIISGQYTFSGVEEDGVVTLTSQVDDIHIIEIQSLSQLFNFVNPYDIPIMVENTLYQVTDVANYSSAADIIIYNTISTPRGTKTIIECQIKAIGIKPNSSVIFSTQEKWILYPGISYQLSNESNQTFTFTNNSIAYLRLTGKRILPIQRMSRTSNSP
jgi:hypothetical protein